MPRLVVLDPAAGVARVGDSIVCVAARPHGALAVGGRVIRPLGFGERWRVLEVADGSSSVGAAVLAYASGAPVDATAADVLVAEVLALHLAGARCERDAPGFAEQLARLVDAGWTPRDVLDADADLVDLLAGPAMPVDDGDGWTSIVLADAAPAAQAAETVAEVLEILERDLVRRAGSQRSVEPGEQPSEVEPSGSAAALTPRTAGGRASANSALPAGSRRLPPVSGEASPAVDTLDAVARVAPTPDRSPLPPRDGHLRPASDRPQIGRPALTVGRVGALRASGPGDPVGGVTGAPLAAPPPSPPSPPSPMSPMSATLTAWPSEHLLQGLESRGRLPEWPGLADWPEHVPARPPEGPAAGAERATMVDTGGDLAPVRAAATASRVLPFGAPETATPDASALADRIAALLDEECDLRGLLR